MVLVVSHFAAACSGSADVASGECYGGELGTADEFVLAHAYQQRHRDAPGLFLSGDGDLSEINVADGRPLWRTPLAAADARWLYDLVKVTDSDVAALARYNWGLVADDDDLAELFRWRYAEWLDPDTNASNDIELVSLAVADDAIVAGTGAYNESVISGLELESGRVRWQTEVDQRVYSGAETAAGLVVALISDDEDFGDY